MDYPCLRGARHSFSRSESPPHDNNMANLHTNWGPHVQRVERLLLAVGLTFLGIWAATQIYRVVASRSAIARFNANSRSSDSPTVAIDPVSGSPVDFQLWSTKRVAAYKESLVQKTDLPLALLRIPSIHLEVPIFDGTDELTLNRGVGRIEGTTQVRQGGNIGIAGHRDGFFRGLKEIKAGDTIELVLSDKTEKYVVEQIQIVTPDDVAVLAPTAMPTLTLVTCFPFYYVGSAPKRFIVVASMKNSSQPDLDTQQSQSGRQEQSRKE
jgi:sortase A